MSAEKSVSPINPASQSGVNLDLKKNHLDEMDNYSTTQQVSKLGMTPAKSKKPAENAMGENELIEY